MMWPVTEHWVEVQQLGRFVYRLTLKHSLPGVWFTMETRPASHVIGARWARRRARRMLQAAVRSEP
jgi:hypothetical protein